MNIIILCAKQAGCDKDCLKFLNVLHTYTRFKNDKITLEKFMKSCKFIEKVDTAIDNFKCDDWIYTDITDDICDDFKKLDKDIDTEYVDNFLWFLGEETFDFIDHGINKDEQIGSSVI